MATSSTNAINEGSQQYPYPSHVHAASFVCVKLTNKRKYVRWREQMTCLLKSHDMLGFIDGTLNKPQKSIPNFEARNKEWERSDALVKGWIYGSLSEYAMETVVGLQTASDVWNTLQKNYTTPATTTRKKRSQRYPRPSHVNAVSFLSLELTGQDNYVPWRDQMTCLLECHDVLGFIDGTLKKPEMNMPDFESKYSEWKKSDTLVKGWIYGAISEDVMGTVVGLETASDVWNMLQTNYAPLAPETPPVTWEKDFEDYTQLGRAIQMGEWEKVQEFFNGDPDALTARLTVDGRTTIHIAVGDPKNIWILEYLLELINPESLPTLIDDSERNPLHTAALIDNTIAAKKLVEKNPNLLFTVDNDNYLPIQKAVLNSHKSTFLYLLQVCKQHIGLISQNDGYYNPFEGERGAFLVTNSIVSGFFDVALDLLKDHPVLARTKGFVFPLKSIAMMYDAYPSAKKYNFYQRFIYSHVETQNYCLCDTNKIHDIENQETYSTNLVTKCMKSYICPVIQRISVKFWKVAVLHVPHIKHIHEDKVKHNTALMLLKFICEEVAKLRSNHYEQYGAAFIEAVINNTPEVVEQITKTFPESIWIMNGDGYSLNQLSIMNRCENVYNFLVHDVTQNKYLHAVTVDKHNNNLLHLAGHLAPAHKLNTVTGAALQMQRELQWFQKVSKFMRPKEREEINNKSETPIMVFRREHKDLRKEGEDWMKQTANSYTITAALIVTIVFAAAITVPGGTNGDNGKPIYETQPSFIIFAVSDAISLFTSTTSLLLFLSILTARYAEEDFLYKLPLRLILGLVMLFVSVTTMMIAFSATLYLMFSQWKSWILIPVAALTCLPIASFVTLQLPLLVDLVSSTYGHGIFLKRSELRITS